MSIQVTSREESATRDPFEQNHRHARIGVIVHLAEGAGLKYETFGACGERFKTKAATDREKGALAQFLVKARMNHLTSSLLMTFDTHEEREFLRGLGVKPHLIEPGP